ncbi:MAG: polysaccharide pyruvyl transferase CsaB [Bacillota bacterium]
MPKVVISGYYGFGNCGDEAMLFAIVTQLSRRIPGLQVVVLSQRPEDTARDFGVRSVSRRDLRLIWRELRDADLFLSGGGSLFQDVTSPRSIFYYAALILLARLRRKKICLYGQGIGPLNHRLSRFLVGRAVRLADLVTLRDETSVEELAALGVSGPMYVTADPVLGLEEGLGGKENGRALLEAAGVGEGPILAVSLRRWPQLERSLAAVTALADRVAGAGWQVVLTPLQRDDLAVLRLVQKQMRQPAVLLENFQGFRDLMAVTSHFDLCVGMRLHFLIFAAMFAVPAVGLSYDPKVARFMHQVGLPALPVESVAADDLIQAVDGLLSDLGSVRSRLRERVRELRARAEENADLVAALLRGGE